MSTYIEARGGPGNDVISTGPGASFLDGGPGDDSLQGGPGGDSLTGGTGSDALDGGPGVDVAGFYLEPGRVVASLRTGSARQGDELDRLLDIEDFSGGPGQDVIEGDDASNVLSGGGGDDRLAGLEGADTLQADEVDLRGDDISAGGPGEDDLLGGLGNDTMESKSGCDAYDGGPGDDFLILDRLLGREGTTRAEADHLRQGSRPGGRSRSARCARGVRARESRLLAGPELRGGAGAPHVELARAGDPALRCGPGRSGVSSETRPARLANARDPRYAATQDRAQPDRRPASRVF